MGKLRFLSAHPLWVVFLMITWGLVFILQGIAWSEELKKESIIMTLPELIGMAIAKSPEIGEIQSEIGAARSDLEQVKAAYFPQLESTALVRSGKGCQRAGDYKRENHGSVTELERVQYRYLRQSGPDHDPAPLYVWQALSTARRQPTGASEPRNSSSKRKMPRSPSG